MIPGFFAAAQSAATPVWTPASLALPIWGVSDSSGNIVSSNQVTSLENLGSSNGPATPAGQAARNDQATLNSRAVITAASGFNGYYAYPGGATEWGGRQAIYLFAVTAMRSAESATGTRSLLSVPRIHPINTGVAAEIARNTGAPNGIRAGGRRLSEDAFAGASDSENHGNDWCIIVGELDFSGGVISLYVDGSLSAQNTTGLTSGLTPSVIPATGLTIGATNSGSNINENYHLAEWGIGNEHLDPTDRQRLEGYLAHEWGLAGSLPVSHPYRNEPP